MRGLFVAGSLAVVIGSVLFLPLAVAAGLPGAFHEPTQAALEEIPGRLRTLYLEATGARCPSLPWSVLAGVGRVESNHGRIGDATLLPDGRVEPAIVGPALDGSPGVRRIPDSDDGAWDGDLVYDRAVGPMQFIPSTWRAFGTDASGDGVADPHNAADAVHAAAAYLCASGADSPSGLRAALLAYNNSGAYVDEVLYHAARYGWGSGLSVADPGLIAAVLANPRLVIYPAGRQDIAAGRIDARVLALLQHLSTRYTLTVSSLKTGHSKCVGGGDYPGCRISHHWYGRGVDISAVDGVPVQSANGDAYAIVMELVAMEGSLRPDQIGSPWPEFEPLPGAFSDAAHRHHLHLSFVAEGR